jgi:Fe2+ or Zn2+ uptake regulation protein
MVVIAILLHLKVIKMTYFKHAEDILLKNNSKLTASRIRIIKFLEISTIPCNAYDIAKNLNSNGKTVDIVSIYRTLSLFEKLNLVHKTSERKFIACQKFECTNSTHCHHQFVCTSCHKTEEIHVNDKSFVRKLAKIFPKLSINSHSFQFEGLCEKCKK